MINSGIKASALIQQLQELIRKHGDKAVFHGGSDYPEGVHAVGYRPKHKGDGYIPGDSFEVW